MNDNYIDQDLFSYTPPVENKFYFSYSKFSLYKECPLKYKFKYIDKLKEKPKPFFIFGRIIHEILEYFFSRVPPPSQSELIEIFINRWNQSSPEEKGYLKKEYEKFDIEKGINILKNFYNKHKDNDKIPFLLEYSTFVEINGITFQIIADKIEYNGNGKITIVDYKTGREGERGPEQLFFYQKICENDPVLVEKIRKQYNEDVKNVEVFNIIYYYIESLKEKRYFRAKDKEIDLFWQDVTSTIKDIKDEKFEPAPSEKSCFYCDFKQLCPVYKTTDNSSKAHKLAKEYLEITENIEELLNRKKEIEKELIPLIDDHIKVIKENRWIKVKKIHTYQFTDREKIIEILKENNLYEKTLKPTIQSIIDLIDSPEVDEELKRKIREKMKTDYKLSIEKE